MQFSVGWAHVALLGALIFINIAVMFCVQIKTIKRKIKLCCLKRSHKKRMKEYESRKILREKLKSMVQNPAVNLETEQTGSLDRKLKVKTKKLRKGSKNKKVLNQTRTNNLNSIPEAS